MSRNACSEDRFLGGRITARQPRTGFRAGHDTVLLAAAVPAVPGERVLELGAGVGIASLCLATRVPDLNILGVELDAELAAIANANAAANGMSGRVTFLQGDVRAFAQSGFDHVFFNPPFHPASGQQSPSSSRDRAMRDVEGAVGAWTQIALAAVKPGGMVTAILRADRAEEMLAAAKGRDAVVFPLRPREGAEPKRVIVRMGASTHSGLRTAAGLILHQADGRNTDAAEAVLRHAEALSLD